MTLSSIVSQSLPGTTINLRPGTYADPDHCYMVFNQSGIRLIAERGGATFSCSACAGAALVLAASGTELRGIVFKGLTLMGGGGGETFEASLVETNVTGSHRSHYDAAEGYLINLQAGLDISGAHPMAITLTSCFVSDNQGSGIRFSVPGGQLNLVASRVSANTNEGNGGGIRVISGGLMLSGSHVLNNVAQGAGASGGGISFEGSTDTLYMHSASSIVGNTATSNGKP